jgi:hypothetical protein
MAAMKPPKDKDEALRLLARSFVFNEQLKLRRFVDRNEAYYRNILSTYLHNPFLRLTEDERAVAARVQPPELGQLIAIRDAVSRSKAPRPVVFCMPKSGSSFVQSAIKQALDLPLVSLTSFGTPGLSSHFGMNGREQELDELAVLRAVLTSPAGFVAQHHTRYTPYLALQMNLFGLTPVVTVRNVFDCIVSFDDMMVDWRRTTPGEPWASDAQFALPADYPQRPAEERYAILAPSFGVWLVNFYLSWKRGSGQNHVTPLVIRYEDRVLGPDRLIADLCGHLSLSDAQKARLAGYVAAPDKRQSRLNVGKRGRGLEMIPQKVRAFLTDYAAAFRPELGDEDLAYLVA